MPAHTLQRLPRPALPSWLITASALMAWPLAAHAVDYFKWDMVELPASTGAACGNGTPYRFFVNRTPLTTKTIVIFEGGGACYEKEACLYRDGFLGAINPNGIPTDYMTNVVPSLPNAAGTKIGVFNSAVLGYITPFATRINANKVETQSWNIVYAPYCTGDVYTGNRTAIYPDAQGGAPLVYQHKGNVNTEAMARWLKANMPTPSQLLVTGFSAGGIGATANYPYVRETLKPGRSALLADSGPLFNVPRNATPAQAPSVKLHEAIRAAWGIDGPQGMVQNLLRRYPQAGGDVENLGSLNLALARAFPKDRLGFTLTQSDKLFAAFAYDHFFPEIPAAPTITERDALRVAKWRQEVGNWVAPMKAFANLGYYLPYSRENILKSHTTTMLTFDDTGVPEAGTASVTDFVADLLHGEGPVMKVQESPQVRQPTFSDKLSQTLQDWLFGSLGL